MKKIFMSALIILSALAFTACNSGDGGGGSLSVNPSSLTFTAAGETQNVAVTGTGWTATALEGWITVTPKSASFDVTVGATTAERAGSITVTDGTNTKTVQVYQQAPGEDAEIVVWEMPTNIDDLVDAFDTFTLIDKDGDGINWRAVQWVDDTDTPTGEIGFLSESYRGGGVGALNPNNYMILPAQTITTGAKFHLIIWALDPDWCEETYKVVISDSPITSDNCENAEVLHSETIAVGGADNKLTYAIDIPASYENGTIYIGLCHYDTYDMYYLVVDSIRLTQSTPAAAPPASAPKVVNGATAVPFYIGSTK